jgi:hypothetical protein
MKPFEKTQKETVPPATRFATRASRQLELI